MLGFQNLCDMSGVMGEETWKFDVYAESDAILAVLPFGEIKVEIRRQASGMMKLLELAAKKAFETTHYNLTGLELNNPIKFNGSTTCLKKMREFFNKNCIIRSFLNGLDKKDERILITEMKGQ